MDITNEVVAGNLAEIKIEREKEQAAIDTKRDIINMTYQYVESINVNNRQLLIKLAKKNAMTYMNSEEKGEEYMIPETPQSYYLDISRKKRSKEKDDVNESTFLAHNQIAILWAPYDFYIEGKLSHCGINAFNFIKEEGKWIVESASWSVQKEGCEI